MKRALFLSFGLGLAAALSAHAEDAPKYLDPSVPIEQRIDDLIPRMTLQEKVDQVSDNWGSKAIPRLKIPALLKTEGLHSQSYSTGGTVFPHAIAMAATWDTDIVNQIGKQTSIEAAAAGIHCSWSPVLDVARDVRWGRVEETYGESPYEVSRMGVAWITGFQNNGTAIAVPKHFAGHGQGMGGRDSQDIGLSERTMREIHLPSFRAAIEEAHAGGVMAAYGLWDGVPDNSSTTLLQKILRQEWGFDGMVVSDCGGPEHFIVKHAIVETRAEAAALAVIAGVNMECGDMYKKGGIAEALDQNLIAMQQVDDLVRPVLRTKFRLGLFEHPGPATMIWDKQAAYDTADSRALARKVEAEAAVLLKNDKGILPLKKDTKTIAVIGPDADTAQIGDYSPKVLPGQLITVLQGIKAHVGAGTQVVYAPGLDSPNSTDTSKFADAVAAAKGADVAVVVVGDNSHPGGKESTTGENVDGATLDFPGAQRDLIKAVQAANPNVVLVIVNGKPFTLPWEAENIPAILVTWYPGEEGGDATADLLFGDANPSGHLPLTWPRDRGQLPLNYDYHPSGRRYDYYDMPFTPQYRFGYGLSYTTFKYTNLKMAPKDGDPGFVTVTADIENTGASDGDVVPQLYVTDAVASVSTPVAELEGFQRVTLKKGEKKTVSFQLTPYQLSLLDANMVRRVEPGVFRIHVGNFCPDVPPKSTDMRKANVGFTDPADGVTGQFTEPKAYAADFVYTVEAPEKVGGGQAFPVTITVKNAGNLTDVTEATLYSGFALGTWSFELKPGETGTHIFQPALFQSGNLAVVAGTRMISHPISVEKSPAHLDLSSLRIQVDANANLIVNAVAQNLGGDPYEGSLNLKLDGQPVGEKQPLKLQPGEKRKVSIGYTLENGGIHQVQVNDLPAQQISVPGGIGLALHNTLAYLKFAEGSGDTVKNEVTGKSFKLKGAPAWGEGKAGKALLMKDGTGIDVESLDIYRKAFTLSARIKIDQLAKGSELGLFGGRAPMGADQDNTGTVLNAGIHEKKMNMDFQSRAASGTKEVPTGTWVTLTYTYDPVALKGAVYIDGAADKPTDLKPYTGPLETIGEAPGMPHGTYSLDEAVVVQACLTPPEVRVMAQKGIDALRQGDYSTEWRPVDEAPAKLEAVAEIPDGTTIGVDVDIADKDGKVLGTAHVDVKAGKQSYALSGLKPGAQVRLHVKLASTVWGASPVLRSATLGSQHWSTATEWGKGSGITGIVTDYNQP